jgi:hypothetical protein
MHGLVEERFFKTKNLQKPAVSGRLYFKDITQIFDSRRLVVVLVFSSDVKKKKKHSASGSYGLTVIRVGPTPLYLPSTVVRCIDKVWKIFRA